MEQPAPGNPPDVHAPESRQTAKRAGPDWARFRKGALWVLLISIGLSAAAGVIALIAPDLGPSERIFITTLLFGGFSLLVMVCLFVLEKGRARPLMIAGLVSGVLSLTGWLLLIWRAVPWAYDDMVVKPSFTLGNVALFAAATGLIVLLPITWRSGRLTRLGTIVSMIALSLLVNAMIWEVIGFPWYADDAIMRAMAMTGILSAAGLVATPLLCKMESLRRAEVVRPTMDRRAIIELTCPRCGERGPHHAGGSRCQKCALRIHIEIEEPVCACGYPLYGLKSDACPECGCEIGPDDRWIAPLDQP